MHISYHDTKYYGTFVFADEVMSPQARSKHVKSILAKNAETLSRLTEIKQKLDAVHEKDLDLQSKIDCWLQRRAELETSSANLSDTRPDFYDAKKIWSAGVKLIGEGEILAKRIRLRELLRIAGVEPHR